MPIEPAAVPEAELRQAERSKSTVSGMARWLVSSRFPRYVGVQLGLIVIDYGIYLGLIRLRWLQPVPAFLAARTIVGVLAYFAHARVTFQSDEKHRIAAPRYAALLVFNALLAAFVLSRLLGSTGPLWAKLCADVSLLLINFFVIRRFIFRSGD
jgi:putative flippase GtrA